jgi:hypothetical protein
MVRGDGAATPQRRPKGPGKSGHPDDAPLLLVLRRAVVERLRARAIREGRKLENAVEEPLAVPDSASLVVGLYLPSPFVVMALPCRRRPSLMRRRRSGLAGVSS